MTGERIGLIGDNHGHWAFLSWACSVLKDAYGCTSAIQVGDCGFSCERVDHHPDLHLPIPAYAIDGNHEDHALLGDLKDADPRNDPWTSTGLQWQRRGSVRSIDGFNVGFLGGALYAHTEQVSWPPVPEWEPLPMRAHHANYPLEDDVDRLLTNSKADALDLLVTHSCPSDIGIGMRASQDFRWSVQVHTRDRGIDPGPDQDSGEPALRRLWQELRDRRPRHWIFGHWHAAREVTIATTSFISLPPCDPDYGPWRPMWFDPIRRSIGSDHPRWPTL